MDTFPWAAVVTAGGGLVVLIVGFALGRITARSDAKAEQVRWLRDKRFEVFTTFLQATHHFSERVSKPIDKIDKGVLDDAEEALRSLTDQIWVMGLIGPRVIVPAAGDVVDALRGLMKTESRTEGRPDEQVQQLVRRASANYTSTAATALGVPFSSTRERQPSPQAAPRP